MTMMINKFIFPVVAILPMTVSYINDNTSITPVGAILIVTLSFIGFAVVERLDKIISYKELINGI